jgi:SAM-dependent methyltransferase
MERILYHDHERYEDTHWWFLGRRAIVDAVLRGLHIPQGARLVDIGSGAGGMLSSLLPYGEVWSLEGDAESANRIRERYGARVNLVPDFFEQATLPESSFDVVTMFDVLEHIEDDAAALKRIAGLLKPGGMYVATVPARPSLWGHHDVLNRHYRRYLRSDLRRVIESSGLVIETCSYFNTFLFPMIYVVRRLWRLLGKTESDIHQPGPFVNGLLARLFSAERGWIASKRSFPIGVSLLVVARKPVA